MHAVCRRDGLCSVCPGNPARPGDLALGWFITPKGKNDKTVRQWRNRAGIAVPARAAGLRRDAAVGKHLVPAPLASITVPRRLAPLAGP